MRRTALAFMLGLSVTACSEGERQNDAEPMAGDALEKAAVARGLIPGADAIELSGRYERRSDLGVDRFCATQEEGRHAIGALAIFGSTSQCEARGTARQRGENVEIRLRGEKRCAFEARFDGIELVFPGDLPESCASYCSDRASFSGVSFFLVEPGDAAARATPGRAFDSLCE